VIGADETVRVRYDDSKPKVESQRRTPPRKGARAGTQRSGVERSPASRHGQRISAAKREERERRQRLIRLRRWAVILLAVLALLGVVWGLAAIARAPVFAVKDITVNGNRHLQREDVVRLAAIPPGTTLLRLPRSAIEDRLEASPWVADANVSRDFPSSVNIHITERRPIAVVDAGGTELWVVSTDGYWLGKRSAEESGVVVVRDVGEVAPRIGRRVVTKELLNAVKVASGLSPELKSMTRAISAPTVDKTAVITNDDVEIYFGPAVQLAAKDRLARKILQREKGKVVYINVRVVEAPTWRGLDDTQ